MSQSVLRFPILKKIEYIDIIKKGEALLTFTGADVEGKTWRQLQVMIGAKLPAGNYYFTMKQKDDPKIYKGTIKAIGTIAKPSIANVVDPNIKALKDSLVSLGEKVESITQGGGVSVDMLIEVTKSSYQNEIRYLTIEVTRRTNEYDNLKAKFDDLEIERDDYREQLKEASGIGQYISLAKQFLDMRTGKAKPIETLKDSNPSDIPPGIIEVLGVIDWGQVDQAIIYDIINYLKVFATKLPLKG